MELYLVKQQQQSVGECSDLTMVLFVLIVLVGFLLIRVYSLHTKLLDMESQHKMLKTLVSITMEEGEKEMFNSIKIDLPNSEKEVIPNRPMTRGLKARVEAKSVQPTQPAHAKPAKPTTEIFADLKKATTEVFTDLKKDLKIDEVKTEDQSEYEVEEEEHEEDVKDVIPVRKLKIKKRGV